MLFHHTAFLFTFLPIALLLHHLAVSRASRGKYGNLARCVFFVATLVFYGWQEPWWLLPFFVSIAFDFGWARLLQAKRGAATRRAIVAASVIQNLGLLAFFKYWDPIVLRLARTFPDVCGGLHPHELGLPPGISFYTFESLSFVIDVYRRAVVPPRNPLEFFAFIGMFPRLIAGPIVRYRDMVSQFRRYRGMDLQPGFFLFVYGLFLKLCLADSFAVFAPYAFGVHPHLDFLSAWLGAAAYTGQIYFDFAGYSLMAIGLGRCFGFRFPNNFDRPYLSAGFQEFWRRWHITLSTWLRDYLYISLGGNRHGTWRTYRNLFLTMTIGGIWHGAGLCFLLWGAWHGILLCLERAFGGPPRWRPLARASTLLGVLVGWVFFRSAGVTEAARILAAMARPLHEWGAFDPQLLTRNPIAIAFCLIGVWHCFVLERTVDLAALEEIGEVDLRRQLVAAGMFAMALVFGLSQFVVPFLYFQF